MFSWLKKAPKKESAPETSLHSLHIEKRMHARIRYPNRGAVGELPFVVFRGQEIKPTNLSLGGLLIVDAVLANLKSQELVELHFVWKNPPRDIAQMARVVRTSSGGIHLRYEDLNPQLLVNLSLAVKPGIRAQKTSKTDIKQISDASVKELWTSPAGEQIHFYSDSAQAPEAKIRLPPKDIRIDAYKGIFMGERANPKAELTFERKAPVWLLHDLIIFLSNLPNKSERILGLLNYVETQF